MKALRTLSRHLQVRRGNYSKDLYFRSINWIMDVNEAAGNKVAFYFIPEQLHPIYDGCYHLDEPVIRDLLRRIHLRGHEIGLHASYTTYNNEQQIHHELQILRTTMAEEGVQQSEIGGRQHYLRWKNHTTARNLDAAGMSYDSTLFFADHPGFRCGTCHEYQMYDLEQRRALELRQRLLVLMECSVIDQAYMGMGYSQKALEYMKMLKQRCFQFSGDFTLLWHNSHFTNSMDMKFYQVLIA